MIRRYVPRHGVLGVVSYCFCCSSYTHSGQVSPYNVFTVRLVRWITVFFTVVTFLWWTVQLISAFVTPPGLHTPGSGFFAFAYATLTLFNLVGLLTFFATPSQAVRVLCITMSVLLAVDSIIIVAVEKTRHEEGWVGIATALCMAIRRSPLLSGVRSKARLT